MLFMCCLRVCVAGWLVCLFIWFLLVVVDAFGYFTCWLFCGSECGWFLWDVVLFNVLRCLLWLVVVLYIASFMYACAIVLGLLFGWILCCLLDCVWFCFDVWFVCFGYCSLLFVAYCALLVFGSGLRFCFLCVCCSLLWGWCYSWLLCYVLNAGCIMLCLLLDVVWCLVDCFSV